MIFHTSLEESQLVLMPGKSFHLSTPMTALLTQPLWPATGDSRPKTLLTTTALQASSPVSPIGLEHFLLKKFPRSKFLCLISGILNWLPQTHTNALSGDIIITMHSQYRTIYTRFARKRRGLPSTTKARGGMSWGSRLDQTSHVLHAVV